MLRGTQCTGTLWDRRDVHVQDQRHGLWGRYQGPHRGAVGSTCNMGVYMLLLLYELYHGYGHVTCICRGGIWHAGRGYIGGVDMLRVYMEECHALLELQQACRT